MGKKMTRRSFMKGTAAGALGLASVGLMGGSVLAEEAAPQLKAINEPEQWDYESDVVVIGTGTSCYGTIKLADSGLSVIAIEAYATAGGTTGISGGMQWLPNNHFSQELGDTREKSLAYVMTIYSLDVLLFLSGTSLLFHVQF